MAAPAPNNEPARRPAGTAATPAVDTKPVSTPSTNGQMTVMSWIRSLFAKLAQLVRDLARTVIDFTKREPIAVAAAAAIALLLVVKP